jgi:hypothetical protein
MLESERVREQESERESKRVREGERERFRELERGRERDKQTERQRDRETERHNFKHTSIPEILYPSNDYEKRLRYVGHLNNGIPSGHGTMTWKDGQSYTGKKKSEKLTNI